MTNLATAFEASHQQKISTSYNCKHKHISIAGLHVTIISMLQDFAWYDNYVIWTQVFIWSLALDEVTL